MIKILYEDRKIIEEMYNSQMPINRIADRINVARFSDRNNGVRYLPANITNIPVTTAYAKPIHVALLNPCRILRIFPAPIFWAQ